MKGITDWKQYFHMRKYYFQPIISDRASEDDSDDGLEFELIQSHNDVEARFTMKRLRIE